MSDPVASNSQLSQLKEMLNGTKPSMSNETTGGRKRKYSRKHPKKCGGNKHTLGGRHTKHHKKHPKKHHKSRRNRKHH